VAVYTSQSTVSLIRKAVALARATAGAPSLNERAAPTSSDQNQSSSGWRLKPTFTRTTAAT